MYDGSGSDTSSSRSFSYNDAGSITSNSAIGTYVYPVQWAGAQRPHTPLSIKGATLSYDANGNLTAGLGKTLTYDGDNRLTSVVKSGSTTTYAYGPDGSRIKTVATVGTDPAKTTYLLGTSELDDAGVLTKIPNPDIRKIGSTECYVHRDHLASVKLETDSTGAIAMRSPNASRRSARRSRSRPPPVAGRPAASSASATTPTPASSI